MSTTLNTRPYNVHLLAEQPGYSDDGDVWQTRSAALLITDNAPQLLNLLKPAVAAAGLDVRVITRDRRPVPTVRALRRIPWLRIFRIEEDWRRYAPIDALRTLRHRYHWDKDDPDAEQFWSDLAAGDQVLIWDPVWGRYPEVWQALKQCGL